MHMRTFHRGALLKPLLLIAAAGTLFLAQEAHARTESIPISLEENTTFEQKLTSDVTGIALNMGGEGVVQMQIKEGGAWSSWEEVIVDNDAFPWEKYSELFITEKAQALRLKSSTDMRIILHAISASSAPVEWEAADRRLHAPVIIPRWQWGADESLRASKRGAHDIERLFASNDPFLADRIRHCDRRAFLYPDEFREIDRKFFDDEGNPLTWPVGYSQDVDLIAIHHTAESSPRSAQRSGVERMRTIYEYHAIARGWGDIGYNFVIDPEGNIYEGRAGGDYAVGAHAYCNNVGTMGISLMGNFQEGRPSTNQLTALRWLIVYLGDKYEIDPTGYVIHHGKVMPSIVGHRDLGQTACPGQFSEELLPQIRLTAKERNLSAPLFSSVASTSSQNEAALMASLVPVTIPMGARKNLEARFMNVGLDTWNQSTWLLGQGDGGVYFTHYPPHSFVAGFLEEDSVQPGEIGTFAINLQGGLSEKEGTVQLTPVINNERRLVNNTAPLFFSVPSGSPRFTHVTSYFPPLHKTGEDLTGTVKLINSGSVPWEKSTITEIAFELEGGSGEVSVLHHPNKVEPGAQGSFRIRLHNIDEEGAYERVLLPRFLEESPLAGSSITVASRAEPVPDFLYEVARLPRGFPGNDHLLPLPSSRSARGRETTPNDGGTTIEAMAGTELTLSPSEQGVIPLRIRAGKYGIQKSQPIASVVISNPNLTLKSEASTQIRNSFRSPVSLRRFQTEDINVTIKAPRQNGKYTFSIGDLNFTLTVSPVARYTVRATPPERVTRRTLSLEETRSQRRDRRVRRRNSAPPPLNQGSLENPPIRIRLSYSNSNTILTSSSQLRIEGGGNIIFLDSGPAHITTQQDQCKVVTSNGQFLAPFIKVTPTKERAFTTIMTTDKSINRYRGTIECRILDHSIVFINELPIEEYMAGLAEEPDSEPYEKQRAFALAARSYALHYVKSGQRKFPGMPYDGSDSPREFQAYGGVYFEEHNPKWVDAVKSTAGKVISWQRKVVKAPYFSRDDGTTKSALDVWGWTNTPYLDAKLDPWCAGLSNWGHGVGMSGCGAKGQAEEGKIAEEILEYYYPGTRILPVTSLLD